jgi:hypothetical protein
MLSPKMTLRGHGAVDDRRWRLRQGLEHSGTDLIINPIGCLAARRTSRVVERMLN